MATTIPDRHLEQIADILERTDAELAAHYPGNSGRPQPVHTAYVSAASARPDTATRWGEAAIELIDDNIDLFEELDSSGSLPAVRQVLGAQPIQDLRLDFEDGYGYQPDDVEDRDARLAGSTLNSFAANGSARGCGIRVKGLTGAEFPRTLRTLELVLDSAGGVPPGFVFTIPKIRAVQQVSAAVLLCEALESAHGLDAESLRFELQIESPQAVIAHDGTVAVSRAIQLARGRCSGLHYGTYDYSAACAIAPQFQSLEHPVADHAKSVMLAAAAQTGVWVCDGSTQVVPTGTVDEIHAAIRRHHRLVTRSMERGYYQGWDMHPGHLATRWLATFGFHRAALDVAAPRLQAYLDRQRSGVIEEPATAQALAAIVIRGLDCGAFDDDDVKTVAPSCSSRVLDDLANRRTIDSLDGEGARTR